MAARSAKCSSIDLTEGASAALVGGGIITMALFPLALPMIALLAVAAIPLLLVAIAVALLAAAIAAPFLLLRALGRRFILAGSRARSDSPAPKPMKSPAPGRMRGSWLADG